MHALTSRYAPSADVSSSANPRSIIIRDAADPLPPPPLTQSHSTTSITTAIKDRKPSFSRKAASFSGPRRRGSSATGSTSSAIVTDAAAPPALPDYALSAAAKVAPSRDAADPSPLPLRSPASPPDGGFARMLSRTATSASTNMPPPPPTPVEGRNGGGGGTFWQPNDIGVVHQQIVELANKRIATLDYLRRTYVVARFSRPVPAGQQVDGTCV